MGVSLALGMIDDLYTGLPDGHVSRSPLGLDRLSDGMLSYRNVEAPSRLGGSVVTFTPGARTAWHSHPVGQTLFCLSGVGRICFKGEKPQVLNPGDTVNISPDTMYWHGASPDRLFSHLALSEAGEQGQGTAWGTHISDAEYNEAASGG